MNKFAGPGGYKISEVGIYLYGAAMAGFGIIQLVTRNFLSSAIAVPEGIALRGVWMLLSSVLFLLAAAAIFFRIRRQLALAAIAGMYLIFLLSVHLPGLITHIYSGNDWAVTLEGIMISSGAIIIVAQVPDEVGFGARWNRVIQLAGVAGHYLFASALFLFAIQHIIYFDYIVSLIPGWMPLKVGLAYLVIAGYILAGVSFVIGREVELAAFWLGVMFGLWVVLLHAPRAIGKWNVEAEWTSLFVALAVCGVAFYVCRREIVDQPRGLIVLPHV